MNMRKMLGVFIAGASLLVIPGASAPAFAASSAYDGSWNLTFATKAGNCDQAYNFNVNISQGMISHPNLVRFTGQVAKSGATNASVRVGQKFASGSGRLTQTAGTGSWSGYSGTEKCSGIWTAQKV